MGDNHNDNAVELLGAVQLAVMNATSANARGVRAQLSATLRKLCAEAPEGISRLSDAVFAESDFLRDMAWTTESVDAAFFDSQRSSFAAVMDRLIYEVGVTSIRPLAQPGGRRASITLVPSHERLALARTKLAATLTEWARKTQGVANSSMARKIFPRGPAMTRQDSLGEDSRASR